MRIWLVGFVFLLSACPPPPNAGERGEPCLADAKCNGGLVCIDGECLAQPMGQSEDKDTSDENKNDAGTTAVNVTDAGLEMATDAGVTPVTDSGVSPLPTDAGSMVPPMDAGSLAEVTDSGNNAPAPCTDTCADLGHSCGEVCGEVCGTCNTDNTCIVGNCYAEAADVSCTDCSLQVVVLNKTITNGQIVGVDLAIDYQPTDMEPNPRIMDLHFSLIQMRSPKL